MKQTDQRPPVQTGAEKITTEEYVSFNCNQVPSVSEILTGRTSGRYSVNSQQKIFLSTEVSFTLKQIRILCCNRFILTYLVVDKTCRYRHRVQLEEPLETQLETTMVCGNLIHLLYLYFTKPSGLLVAGTYFFVSLLDQTFKVSSGNLLLPLQSQFEYLEK